VIYIGNYDHDDYFDSRHIEKEAVEVEHDMNGLHIDMVVNKMLLRLNMKHSAVKHIDDKLMVVMVNHIVVSVDVWVFYRNREPFLFKFFIV